MTWEPTAEFLHGRLWKPFLPFEKHPNLKNEHFKNLYAGDEVYIFETKDAKWARGYTLTRPFPHDFTITSVNLDELPGLNIKITVFPLEYVKVIERLPLTIIDTSDENQHPSATRLAPTLRELTGIGTDDSGSMLSFNEKPVAPSLPFGSFTFAEDLVSEITYAMNLLMTHIFALYSIGEFRLFKKLSEVYNGLDENRAKLTLYALTHHEEQVVKEITTHLLCKIPKKLASRSARSNEKSYDLDSRTTDISAYKAVLARSAQNGSLLSLANASPAQLALNQQLCALYPNFPVNAYHNPQEFSLMPQHNDKLVHESPLHILVDFKSVGGSSDYQPEGFAGMIAYLYIRNTKKRLTEAFAVHTESVEDLVFVERISAALFSNIPTSEVENTRVFLVAVLTEEICIKQKDTFLPQVKKIKKGVAAGVTDITRVFSRNQGSLVTRHAHRFTIKLFGSFVSKKRFDTEKVENNGWGELVDRIISGSSSGVAVNPRAEKLVVSVKEFQHQLIDREKTPASLVSREERPDSYSAPIAKVEPIFFDPLADNYERIYLSMGQVNVASSIHKGALLTVEISAPNDPAVVFAKASNQTEKPTWQFVSVYSGEVVGEIVKVNGINPHDPKRALKVDFLMFSLYANGVMIGRSEVVFRNEKGIVELNGKPWHVIDFNSPGQKDPVASVQIYSEYIGKAFNTELCIDNILKFEKFFQEDSSEFDELHKSLVEFCSLNIDNVVRFFSELLRALLRIADLCLQDSNVLHSEMILDTVFKAIVNLLDTVFGKMDSFLYVFDSFVAKKNISQAAGIYLLNKIADIFHQAQSNWNSLSRSVCRNLGLLINLALSSLIARHDTVSYINALSSLFKAASFFVSMDNSVLANDQILVIEIPDYVLAFEKELDQGNLLGLILNFIESIGTRGLGIVTDNINSKSSVAAAKSHKVIVTKLLLIQRLYASNLSQKLKNIRELISRSVIWCMEVFLGDVDIDASRLAASVMNCACDLLWKNIDEPGIDLVCFSLTKHLGVLSRTFIRYNKITRSSDFFTPKKGFTHFFQRSYPFKEMISDSIVGEEVTVEVLAELAIIFVYVARIGHRSAGIEGFHRINNTVIENDFYNPVKCSSNNGLSEDITTLLSGIQLIRLGEYFPEEKWLSLYAVIAKGCLSAIELIAPLLLIHFIPSSETPEAFDRSLWGSFYKTLLKLGTLPPVAVEHLSTIPRKACHQITGGMRDRIAEIMDETWNALAWEATEGDISRFNLTKFGGFQVEFIGCEFAILQDLMLFGLQRSVDCQKVAVRLIWTILVAEFIISDSIVEVEKDCLMGLYEIYTKSAYKPGKIEQSTFIERLRKSIRLEETDPARPLVLNFIANITGFLDVLNQLNDVPVGDEFENDRTYHKLNINTYLKNVNKPELFHSFISQMYEDNVKKSDFIQAALSLELLSSTYTWDQHINLASSLRPKFPPQTSFERKESLTKMIAQNFVKGNSLEKAIDTYNELLQAYTEHTYDLKSFAYVHQKLAKLYLDLESSDKLSPSYYRVAYIGAGFPVNIRGKEQIYEGLPFEHITSIHERLLSLYPGARIITDNQQAVDLKKTIQAGRYLHVNAVAPVNEVSDKILNTSIGVRQYARNKNLRFFSTSRKIPGSTSVFDLWIEEVTYETQVSFPTLMNRSEIKNTTSLRLSPLENAIRIILNRTSELVQVESLLNVAMREKANYTILLHDLSRHLAGTVDSPVNGGVGQFRAYFLDPRDDGKSDYAMNIRLLKNAFYDLTTVLSRCLDVHGKLIGSNMKESHDALLELYKQNFSNEIDYLKLNNNLEASKKSADDTRERVAGGVGSVTIQNENDSIIGGGSPNSRYSFHSGITDFSEHSFTSTTKVSRRGQSSVNWQRG